jgi:hypothetical protein
MGALFSHRWWTALPQPGPVPLVRYRLSLGVRWMGLLPGWSLTVDGGSLCLGLVLLFSMCVRRRELLPTPLRDAH